MSSVSTSPYHLPNLHHHHEQGSSSSVPTTPKSSNSQQNKTVFRYDPYNNFNRVYLSSTPRSNSHSASTTPRNRNNSSADEQQEEYCYKNESIKNNNNNKKKISSLSAAFVEELDEIVDSHSCTPTNRMETEQNFDAPTTTPRGHHKRDSSLSSHSDEEMHHHNKYSEAEEDEQEQENINNNTGMMVPKPRSSTTTQQQSQEQEPMRASVRTMQHLLQNVPYLFLDLVAESTVMCRDPHHRVGEHISAWSNDQSPQEIIAMRPDYQGQDIRDVFVAQLPFDLPLSAVQLIADLLIEGPRIHILHAAPHIKAHKSYDGCCFVKMFESDANRFINFMHKRVLFDVDGIWVASTVPELQELTDYCAWFQEQKNDQRKEILKMPTPFSAMTAEFALRGCKKNVFSHQQHRNYNNAPILYDQNPHQRRVAYHHNNGMIQQQQRPQIQQNNQQQQYYSYNNNSQQGTYQQGYSVPQQHQHQYSPYVYGNY